nr:MAG TPA: hypothetical protein [Caudoviricetes sp.]
MLFQFTIKYPRYDSSRYTPQNRSSSLTISCSYISLLFLSKIQMDWSIDKSS